VIKKILTISFIFFTIQSTYAYEDCILSSDGKLGNIKVNNSSIADIYPVITISNEKNMFIIHPLKEGKTKISLLKNDKDSISFNMTVKEDETIAEEVDGIEVLALDEPDIPIELDTPPVLNEEGADG